MPINLGNKTLGGTNSTRVGSTNQIVQQKPKNNQPYIIDLVTLDKLYFQTIPLEISVDPNTTLVALPSLGRNLPDFQYTGAEDTLEFDITWYGDTLTKDDVILKCKWLEALSKNDGYNGAIHPCLFSFGGMFIHSKWLVAKAPYKIRLFDRVNNMYPQLASQTLTLKKINAQNPTRSFIQSVNT